MPATYSAASAAVPSGRIHFDQRVLNKKGTPLSLLNGENGLPIAKLNRKLKELLEDK